MSLTLQTRIGKKYAIYIPKAVVKTLGLKEGQKISLRIVGNTLVIESIQDPIHLALSSERFASITHDQIEEISIEEQAIHTKHSP